MTEEAKKREPYTTPSPSALSLVDMCEARAGARYIEGLKEPEGAKAALGTRGHAITADYLSKGTGPNRAETFDITGRFGKVTTFYPGRMVWNILTHLPPAGTVPNVEKKISLEWKGIKFHERSSIDWENVDGYGDHKFTTSLDYAKRPEQLIGDTQRIIYAADWFQRHDADTTVGQWTYGQFDAKASRKVLVPAQRAEIAGLMDEVIVPKAEKLLGWIVKGVDWRTLPKNTSQCGTFPPYGCPYAAQCPRTTTERRETIRKSLGFPQRPVGTTDQTKVQIGMSSFMEKLRAKKAQQASGAAQTAAANTNSEQVVASEDIEHDAEEAAAAIVGAINPPGEAGDVVDVAAPEESESAEDVPVEQPVKTLKDVMVEKLAAAEQPVKKPRGRPAGSKNKAAQTTLEHQLEASITAPVKAAVVVSPAAFTKVEQAIGAVASGSGAYTQEMTEAFSAAQAGKPITLLLVDCFIARSAGSLDEAVYASDLIAQAHQHIKTTYTVLDYRACGHPELEYGKGAGLLAACIEGLIQDLPAGCVVVVDTRTPEGQIALQPLVAASISVVRGAA